MKTLSLSVRNSLKITLVYLVLSALWIFFSDRLLGLLTSDPALFLEFQTYKGWFFVLITSILLYYLIEKSTSRLEKSRTEAEAALREKKAVLSELHHRVKNNLAIICGLIDLQVHELNGKEETRALESTKYRIFTLAEIEELFYQNSDMSSIPFHEYVKGLINFLNEQEVQKLSFKTNIDDTYLNISQAVPFGLVVNEIFAQFRTGENKGINNTLGITLTQSDSGKVSLEISFEEIPAGLRSRLTSQQHIEGILLDLYTRQLHANSNWFEENGSLKFIIKFEKSAADNSFAEVSDLRLN